MVPAANHIEPLATFCGETNARSSIFSTSNVTLFAARLLHPAVHVVAAYQSSVDANHIHWCSTADDFSTERGPIQYSQNVVSVSHVGSCAKITGDATPKMSISELVVSNIVFEPISKFYTRLT